MRRRPNDSIVPLLAIGGAFAAFLLAAMHFFSRESVQFGGTVYRDAWTHQRAVALLREESGSSLDPKCVAALESVLARERSPESIAV